MKSAKFFLVLVLLCSIFLSGCSSTDQKKEENITEMPAVTNPSPTPHLSVLPPQTTIIDTKNKYFALLKTDLGDIKIQLFVKETPLTVNNFVYLSQSNFFNNTIFHRVIKDFMIQGGDPKGDGTGGPGYQFDDEKFEGEYTRGTVAMANAGPNTNGSQFFIMHQDYQLAKNYVIFGRVVEGMGVVDKIAESAVVANDFQEMSKPINPVSIKSVEIIGE